jgi:hypothetical protein
MFQDYECGPLSSRDSRGMRRRRRRRRRRN